MLKKTPKIENLIKQCQAIVAKHKGDRDDPELWNEIEKQINYITEFGKLENSSEFRDFGPILARNYDSIKDKNEMQPLYSLYLLADTAK